MTLASTTTKKDPPYAGDGTTVAFAVPFKFLANSHVKAIHVDGTGVETTWVEGTDYTLSGAGVDAGGTLTATTAPVTGATLHIRRDAPDTQGTDLPAGGAFPADTVEDALDLLTMLVQQQAEEIARAMLVAETETPPALTLPSIAGRASKFLAFDALGGPIASAGPTGSSTIPVSSFIETLLDDADAATARTTLGAGDTFGPASATDNALARFDGTGGKTIQNSAWTLDDSDALLAADKVLQRPELKDYAETKTAISSSGGILTIDLENGNVFSLTTTEAITTVNLNNPPASGKGGSFTLILTQDATGRAITWPAAVKWPGGTAPTINTASKVYVLTFLTVDGGTAWYGFMSGSEMA